MPLDDLDRVLTGALHRPGSETYGRATTPFNATVEQRPAAVVTAADAGDVAAVLDVARSSGLQVLPQATGHGARALDAAHLLLDTSALDEVRIDVQQRRATVGAGATWGRVQAEAERHGLLGLAGTSPTVGAAAYTFGGGLGWLTRPHGLASAHLHAVELVDGAGEARRLTDDGDDRDRDALWVCRGGGGVGIATAVEIGLVPAADVWVGTLVWPADRAADVVAAWADATRTLASSVTSVVGVGLAPPTPALPEDLHGRALVRVIAVSTDGEGPWTDLRGRLLEVAAPALDVAGPGDATRLGQVHLDPPVPAAGLGEGRWLDGRAADLAADVLTCLGTGADLPLLSIELRHVATDAAPGVDGALTESPGPYLLHALGRADSPDVLRTTRDAVGTVHHAAQDAWIRRAASFTSNLGALPDAFEPAVLDRLRAVHAAVDPDGLVVRPPVVE